MRSCLGAVLLLAGCATAPPAAPPAAPPQPPALKPYTEQIPGTTVTFEMLPVPGTRLWMGRTEVTWDEFEAWYLSEEEDEADAVARPTPFYEPHDRGWGRARRPAVGFSRHAAEQYCVWISRRTGRTYRLPTEAEWENACGADPAAVTEHAWFGVDRTREVARKEPNAIGLYDMLGNAMEYCAGGEEQFLRGGCWKDEAVECASRVEVVEQWNARDPQRPRSKWWLTDAPWTGFRVVRAPE